MTTNEFYTEFFETNQEKNEILNHFNLVDIIHLLRFGTIFLNETISENINKRFNSEDFDKTKNKIEVITKNYNDLITSYKILMN